MTPNGIAEYSPAIPTSGEVIEPNKKGMIPNSAEALPAMCPCDSIAKVNDIGPTIPNATLDKKSEKTSAANGP